MVNPCVHIHTESLHLMALAIQTADQHERVTEKCFFLHEQCVRLSHCEHKLTIDFGLWSRDQTSFCNQTKKNGQKVYDLR